MSVVREQFCGMNPAASPASGACYPKLRVSTLRIVILGVVRVGRRRRWQAGGQAFLYIGISSGARHPP